MRLMISTVLLWLSAALLAFDGVMHGFLWGASGLRAIARATLPASVGARPALPAVFGAELQVLWMADVVNLVCVAAVCALAAVSPRSVSSWVLLILAMIPMALGVLLYTHGGPPYVANMQLGAAAMILTAGALRLNLSGPAAR